jgi:hypothetical protein
MYIGLEFECPDEFVMCIIFEIIAGRGYKTVIWYMDFMICQEVMLEFLELHI